MTAVKVLSVGAKDLGVIAHHVKEKGLYQVEVSSKANNLTTVRIRLGKNKHYDIDQCLIETYADCQIYDGKTKVLEWSRYKDGILVVQAYTDKQINFFAALQAPKCFVKATGSLAFHGTLDVESLTIDAKALIFKSAIKAQNSICVRTHQGIGFWGPVTTKNLTINSAYIHQEAELNVSELLDISTQFFKQNTSVKTLAKTLRLIAAQCEMQGELTVSERCFLTTYTLVWGHDANPSTFRILGESYIRAASAHLKGDMQVRIQNPVTKKADILTVNDIKQLVLEKKCLFVIEKELIVDEQAAAVLANTTCFLESTNNQGQLLFDGCIIKAQHVAQYGIIDFKQSKLLIEREFSQHQEAVTEFARCFLNVTRINIYGGELSLTQCFYQGTICNGYKGSLTFNDESNIELTELFVDTQALVDVKQCQIKVANAIVAFGALSFDCTTATTSHLKIRNGVFRSKNSKVISEVRVYLSGITNLIESEFTNTKEITIEGEVSVDKAQLSADVLKLNIEKASTLKSLRSSSRHLQLQGSGGADQVIFHESAFITQMMSCVAHVTLDTSIIYGVPDKKITHDLRARLKLKNSKFITENDIKNHQDGRIELEDKSFLKVRLLHSQGAMKAKDSGVSCTIFLLGNGCAEFEASTLEVEDKIISQASKIELKKGSELITSIAELLDKSALILKEGSTVTAKSELINDYSSAITSSSSKISAKKFKSLGHTELCSSLLSASELEIYNTFVARSSQIEVDELISISKKAHVQLDSSLVHSNEVSVSGTVRVNDSLVNAKKGIKTKTGSRLILKGETKLEADNIHIQGSLQVQTKSKPASKVDSLPESKAEEKELKATPLIKANKELTVSENATIKGDEDLQIEAKQLVQSGTISCTGQLKATGGLLINHGLMEAENIHLGFDEQVRNSGTLLAEDITIHSSLINKLGQIYARKSLLSAGLYGINTGLIAANNYSNLSLLSLNAGLVVPNFSADLSYIFTWSNALSLARIAATTMFPNHNTTINAANLALRIPSLINSGYGLYNMASNFSWQRYQNMRRHELIAELCQVKSHLTSAYSASTMAYSLSGKLPNLAEELSDMKTKIFDINNYSADYLKSWAADLDYTNFAMRSSGVFLGNYTDESLISANLGCSLAIDTAKKNLFTFNSGVECSLLSHNTASQFFVNTGWSGGTDTFVETGFTYNRGMLEGLHQLSMDADKVVNTGTIKGDNAFVAIKELSQEGTLALSNGLAKIDEFHDTEDASSTFISMQAQGTDFEANGQVCSKKSRFVYENKFELKEGSMSTLHDVSIKAHEFTQGGQVNYEGYLAIEADKANLQQGSVMNGKQTAEDELYVIKEQATTASTSPTSADKPDESSTTESEAQPEEPSSSPIESEKKPGESSSEQTEKEFKPQHVLLLKVGEQLDLDGTLNGGDFVEIQGKDIDEPAAKDISEVSENKEKPTLKCEKVNVGEHADISIGHGSIDAKQVTNAGKVELYNTSLAIDSLEQNKQMKMDSCAGTIGTFNDRKALSTEVKDSSLSGTIFTSSERFDAQHSRFVYEEEFELKEGSVSTLHDVSIKTHEFMQSGQVNYEGYLEIEADKANLQQGSVMDGKQTAKDELYVIKDKTNTAPTLPTSADKPEKASVTESEAQPEELDSSKIDSEKKPEESNPEQIEKEFKPQHILLLKVGEELGLDGTLQGGDYVQIQGKSNETEEVATNKEESQNKTKSKCSKLVVGDHADINISHGSVNVEKFINKGTFELHNTSLAIDDLEQNKQMKLDGCVGTIGTFNDSDTARTVVQHSGLEGTTFTANGQLDAQGSRFNYKDKITFNAKAQVATDNVELLTDSFEHSGKLTYQNLLFVKAKAAFFHEGSTTNGQQTAEDELFVTSSKPSSAEEGVDNQTEQKEFKPKHILDIQTEDKISLEGSLTGGDYTAIRGLQEEPSMPSAEEDAKKIIKVGEVVIGEKAHIVLNHGVIEADRLVNKGLTELSHFSLDVGGLEQQGKVSLEGCGGQIDEFSDSVLADTRITDSVFKGESFQLKGNLDSKHSSYDYKKSFVTESSSQFQSNNDQIFAGHFQHAGKLNYQNQLTIKATHADLKKGSAIVGKETSDDQLFVPKEQGEQVNGAVQTSAEQTGESAEIAKDFKPQHIFVLETQTGVLNGELKGGDYHIIRGISAESDDSTSKADAIDVKSDCLTIGDSAQIDLRYGSISSKQMNVSSQMSLKGFSLDVDKTRINKSGYLGLTESVFKGDELYSSGRLSLEGTVASFSKKVELDKCASETLNNSRITTGRFVDASQMSYKGQAEIITDHYDHSGRVAKLSVPSADADKNLFYVNAKTASLKGSADLDHALFDIDHFSDANQFIAGRGLYSAYKASKSLEVDTLDYITLNAPITRDCDLVVKGSGITLTAEYNKNRSLALISTKTDVKVLANVKADKVYIKSAGGIRTNHSIYAKELIQFEADGGFYNQGGVINGDVVSIKAKEIQNISSGSYAASAACGVAMGTSGIINGRKDVYLEATGGDIANYGGIIRSGNYTQLMATNNVLNLCNIGTQSGAYGAITTFDSGLIAGGKGSDTEGFGLYVKAGGQVYADASTFISNGNNYIEGDRGIVLKARQETHISDISKRKTWYGKSRETITTQTSVTSSMIKSATGANILKSEHGGVTSIGTAFVSQGGTHISARDDVQLYSLKTQSHQFSASSSLWGLSKHSKFELYQDAVPTLFYDNGVTRIYSELGSIDARGAYFCGEGDLDMRAKNGRIKFGVDTLNHYVDERSRSFGVSVPGMGAWSAWKNSNNIMSALTAEDATLAKLYSVLGSNNTPELLANSANLGVNLYNATNSLARGFANDTLKDELLARYGLGSHGFFPSATVSMTTSRTNAQYQTLGMGGVNRGGNVYLEAGKGIDLENGVRVHAGGNMTVDAPEIVATSAALHASFEQVTNTQSIGVSALGQLQDVSVGCSHTSTTSTQHALAELSATGSMKLGYQGGAMKQVILDGAVINAGSMDADIEKLTITDKQDLSTTKTESLSASLSGQISAYKGHGDLAIVKDHSGIFIANNAGHTVTIAEAHMTGGIIQTGGGDLTIDKLVTEQVLDHNSYSGIGINFNVNDLQRLAGKEATNQTGEQAIAIAEVTIDKVDYKAEHTAVAYGGEGAHVEIKETVGQVHTTSADGTQVIKNKEVHLTVDLPMTNHSHIEKSAENIQEGVKKLSTVLGLGEQPTTELPPMQEPGLPSRRTEEEEEEEEETGEKTAEDVLDLDKKKDSVPNTEELHAFLNQLFSSMPDENKQEIGQILAIANKELKELGKISDKTDSKLRQKILSALNTVMKAGTEDMWAKLAKAVGSESTAKIMKMLSTPDKLSMKLYFGAKGTLFISLPFNLLGAAINGAEDVWDRAVKNTTGDLILNFAIRTTARGFSGPVGLGFLGIGIIDTFFYDEKIVAAYIDRGSNLSAIGFNSLAQGHYFNSTFILKQAQDNYRAAAGMEMLHIIANAGARIGDKVGDILGKIIGKTNTPAPRSAPIVNKNTFFKVVPTEAQEEIETRVQDKFEATL